MTDKVQKIREKVEMVVSRRLNLLNGDYFDLNKEVDGFTNEIMDIVDSLQEEPVSENFEEASKEWLRPQLDKSYANYGEGKMMELTHFDGYAMLYAIEFGAQWQKEHLWKPADGEDLPEIEREVVVFTQNFPDDAGIMRVAIAHRPDPKGWDGKSIATGKVEHYTPKTYGKGGWNIPDVVMWLDLDIPKLEED